jgi:hypothetical protein
MKRSNPIARISADIADAEVLPIDTVALSQSQIRWAINLSELAGSETQKWQTYLNRLGISTLQQWLKDRLPTLKLKEQVGADPLQSSYIQANQFRLHILILSSLPDREISISKQVIQSKTPPDFYVLVEVHEEIKRSRVCGYLRHDSLLQKELFSHASAPTHPNYLVPQEWFDPEPENLLLLLRHCQSPNLPPPNARPARSLPLINVARWFKNDLGRVALSSNWNLLPPLAVSVMRSPSSVPIHPETMLRELMQSHDIMIPAHAHSKQYSVNAWHTSKHRLDWSLRAVAWESLVSGSAPVWMLLLILSAQPGKSLPAGLRLQVRDDVHLLADLSLEQSAPEHHLYAHVSGMFHEQFWVTLSQDTGERFSLPPICFSDIVPDQFSRLSPTSIFQQ